MSDIYNTWKGNSKSAKKSHELITGAIYSGTISKGRSTGQTIVGILMESHEQYNTAVLRCKENFPHCVSYISLKAVV